MSKKSSRVSKIKLKAPATQQEQSMNMKDEPKNQVLATVTTTDGEVIKITRERAREIFCNQLREHAKQHPEECPDIESEIREIMECPY